MTAADQVRELLHQIASSLFWPVLVALLLLCVVTLVAIGRFAKEFVDRCRGRFTFVNNLEHTIVQIGNQHGTALDIAIEEAIQLAESRRAAKIARLRMVVRLGPSLGLMGTLIPMASALQGLSEGNLPSLASNMVTAFAATVVGLSLSTIAYAVTAFQEVWLKSDARLIAFKAERLLRERQSAVIDEVSHAIR